MKLGDINHVLSVMENFLGEDEYREIVLKLGCVDELNVYIDHLRTDLSTWDDYKYWNTQYWIGRFCLKVVMTW